MGIDGWKIVLWAAPIIGAVFGFIANFKINKLEAQEKQEKERIEVVKAAEKEKELHSIIKDSLDKKVKSVKPTKTMADKIKSGDTYNVTSNNQTGGITAGMVEINVAKEEQVNELDIPLNDNFVVFFDKTNLRFDCKPKVGKWEKPYIAISFEEKEAYKKFGSQALMLHGFASGIDCVIGTTRLWGSACGFFGDNEKPATSKFSYYAEFNKNPSYIVFGNYGKVLYKYNTSNGLTSILPVSSDL